MYFVLAVELYLLHLYYCLSDTSCLILFLVLAYFLLCSCLSYIGFWAVD
jgi:hypothetical protein